MASALCSRDHIQKFRQKFQETRKEKTTNIVEIWPPLLLLLTPKTYKKNPLRDTLNSMQV